MDEEVKSTRATTVDISFCTSKEAKENGRAIAAQRWTDSREQTSISNPTPHQHIPEFTLMSAVPRLGRPGAALSLAM
jgi:hypothetical protein